MSSKATEICAAVGATLLVTGAVTLALIATDIEDRVVKPNPKPVVRVSHVPMVVSPPVVIFGSHPTAVSLPYNYPYDYVVYGGNHYVIRSRNNKHYYEYNGVRYPVYYYNNYN